MPFASYTPPTPRAMSASEQNEPEAVAYLRDKLEDYRSDWSNVSRIVLHEVIEAYDALSTQLAAARQETANDNDEKKRLAADWQRTYDHDCRLLRTRTERA